MSSVAPPHMLKSYLWFAAANIRTSANPFRSFPATVWLILVPLPAQLTSCSRSPVMLRVVAMMLHLDILIVRKPWFTRRSARLETPFSGDHCEWFAQPGTWTRLIHTRWPMY